MSLPVRLTVGHPHDLSAGASARVLVLVKNFTTPTIGRYIHELEQWQVDGWTGSPEVVEWWTLPEKGTGNKP